MRRLVPRITGITIGIGVYQIGNPFPRVFDTPVSWNDMDFQHKKEDEVMPHSETYKQFHFFCRSMYLITIFIPTSLVGLAAYITQSKAMKVTFFNYMRSTFESAGFTFQKFGQWIASRTDIYSREFTKEMAKLREHIPEHDMDHTRREIENSFGIKMEAIFEEFQIKPIASGSCGQVYRAKLKREHAIEGQIVDVAVKIRHPSIVEESLSDPSIIFKLGENVCDFMNIAFPLERSFFEKTLRNQMDFTIEARNLIRLKQNFHKNPKVTIPTISKRFVSSSVLVESWIEGDSLDSISNSNSIKTKNLKDYAKLMIKAHLDMCLLHNFIHQDLHLGNVIASDDGIAILDAGMVTSIDPKFVRNTHEMLYAITIQNDTQAYESICSMSGTRSADLLPKISTLFAKYSDRRDYNDMIGELIDTMDKCGVRLPDSVTSVIQSASLVQSSALELWPNLDVSNYVKSCNTWKSSCFTGN